MKKVSAFIAVIGLSIIYSQTGEPLTPSMAVQQAGSLQCDTPRSCGQRPAVNLAGLFF